MRSIVRCMSQHRPTARAVWRRFNALPPSVDIFTVGKGERGFRHKSVKLTRVRGIDEYVYTFSFFAHMLFELRTGIYAWFRHRR